MELAQDLEAMTEKFFRKHLILNVDGCIAALISEMGFDWRIGKGFFISAVPQALWPTPLSKCTTTNHTRPQIGRRSSTLA